MSLGRLLSTLRKDRGGPTQEQLAFRIDRQQTQISRMEHQEDMLVSSLLEYLDGLEATDINLVVTFLDKDYTLNLSGYVGRTDRRE